MINMINFDKTAIQKPSKIFSREHPLVYFCLTLAVRKPVNVNGSTECNGESIYMVSCCFVIPQDRKNNYFNLGMK